MSTIQNNQTWPLSKEILDSKYEKCRNITEEIYKRINITFQIKKLETAAQSELSDASDQIDSNELSNETDLFACDKSDSIPSSEAEGAAPRVYTNINNNEERAKPRRPKKRFRKRIKKRQSRAQSETDDSDETVPLSRVVEDSRGKVLQADLKSRNTVEKKHQKASESPKQGTKVTIDNSNVQTATVDKTAMLDPIENMEERKTCAVGSVK